MTRRRDSHWICRNHSENVEDSKWIKNKYPMDLKKREQSHLCSRLKRKEMKLNVHVLVFKSSKR